MSIFDIFRQIESAETAVTGSPDWIIAGLGNIGDRYRGTRHNAGFIMIDDFAGRIGTEFRKHQFKAKIAMGECSGVKCLLMKPDTYMNLSGQAVTEAMQFYHIPPEHVLVIYDDINLDVGGLRIRAKGSDGGHNGMKNIIYLSGADTFPRIRVGIGKKPHPDSDLAAWVLSAFTPEECESLKTVAGTVAEAIPLILQGRIDLAMSRCNAGKPKQKTQPASAQTPAQEDSAT